MQTTALAPPRSGPAMRRVIDQAGIYKGFVVEAKRDHNGTFVVDVFNRSEGWDGHVRQENAVPPATTLAQQLVAAVPGVRIQKVIEYSSGGGEEETRTRYLSTLIFRIEPTTTLVAIDTKRALMIAPAKAVVRFGENIRMNPPATEDIRVDLPATEDIRMNPPAPEVIYADAPKQVIQFPSLGENKKGLDEAA